MYVASKFIHFSNHLSRLNVKTCSVTLPIFISAS